MNLAVNLEPDQIKAAIVLRRNFPEWRTNDRAIRQIRNTFRGFGDVATLVKVVVVNTIYGTRVFDYQGTTTHVKKVLSQADIRSAGPELVERLARVRRGRRFHSFASKFAHLFINAERFPILDVYAERTIKFHLGRKNLVYSHRNRYVAFVENFERLKSLARLNCTVRQLDHYLWFSGLYREWRRRNGKARKRINKEVRNLFRNRVHKELLARMAGT